MIEKVEDEFQERRPRQFCKEGGEFYVAVLLFFFLEFWLCHLACGISAP